MVTQIDAQIAFTRETGVVWSRASYQQKHEWLLEKLLEKENQMIAIMELFNENG